MFAKFLGEASKHGAYALLFGKFLKKQDGARFLTSSETDSLLASRNRGLLLDGKNKRLSERESYQNICVISRIGAGTAVTSSQTY